MSHAISHNRTHARPYYNIIKVLLNQACRLASIHQLYVPFEDLDKDFNKVVRDILEQLQGLGILQSIVRNSVLEGHNVAGLHGFRDGSTTCFGTTLYVMTSQGKNPKIHYNIIGSKSRLSI